MKYPLTSLSLATVIYLLLALGFFLVFYSANQAPKVSLVIDANLIGEVHQHEISKVKKKKSKNLKKISDQKKYQKSKDEKIEPVEPNPVEKEEESEFKKISQTIAPIYQPLPKIPNSLRLEAFHSKAVARFFILASGKVAKVQLIRPCRSPKLNHLLLKSLRNWKFPANSTGFEQEIKVTFKVE